MFFPWGQRVNKWLFWMHWVIIELIQFSLGWASGYFWCQSTNDCFGPTVSYLSYLGKSAFLGIYVSFMFFPWGQRVNKWLFWIHWVIIELITFSLGWASGYFWRQVDWRCHICGKLAFLGYLCVFHVFSLGSEGQQMIVLDTLGHYWINNI